MQQSARLWIGLIAILVILLVGALALLFTGNFPTLISLEPSPTPTPPPTHTPTPLPTDTPVPTPTDTPEPARSPTTTPTNTATPLPPFPSPKPVVELPERPLRIVYMSLASGDWEIIVAEADGSNPRNISDDPGFDAFPDWSAHSEQLTWSSDRFGEGLEIVVADLDGRNLSDLSNHPDTDDALSRWSPNGQLLAFLSTRFRDAEVFIATLDGINYNLSDHQASDIFFDWSPTCAMLVSGSGWGDCRLLFGSDRGNQTQDLVLYQVSPDGENFNFVAGPELAVQEAIYSPDGGQVAYVREDEATGALDLFLLDLATEQETRLTDDAAIERSIAWSPAGGVIAYISDADGDNDIYGVSVPAGEISNLTDTPFQEGLNGDFSWSPDGSRILFSTDRDEAVDIYVIDADGGNPTNLTNSPEPEIEAIWIR